MRSMTRLADKLVTRFAPKAAAAAADCYYKACGAPGCLQRCCPGKPCGHCYCP